jgi:hypothetical protein
VHVVGENTETINIKKDNSSFLKQAKSVKKVINNQNVLTADGNESYIIEGIPYVSQETGFYSTYASPTMIFKYYGINTTLEEVLFILGVGYSIAYLKHSLLPGWQISRDYNYISNLYGLSHEKWLPNEPADILDSGFWERYWTKIKENITKDIPVLTITNEISYNIKSCKLLRFKYSPKPIMRNIHAIVIVGFNESNQTICFNDPSLGIKYKQENGHYIWRDLTDFQNGYLICRNYYPVPISTFKKVVEPIDKVTLFEMAHMRNIERLNGNTTVYYDDWILGNVSEKSNGLLGIKALEKYKKITRSRLKHNYLILPKKKFIEIKNGEIKNSSNFTMMLSTNFLKNFGNIFSRLKISCKGKKMSKPFMVYTDKNYTLQYLKTNSDLLNENSSEIQLFEYELENWSKLNYRLKKFSKLGLLLRLLYRKKISNNIVKILENIIKIENEIILNSN